MKTTKKARRASRQLFRLCRVNGTLDGGRVRLIAQRVAASRRRDARAVLASLRRLVRLDCDRHRAVIESAAPLPDDLRTKVRTHLTHAYGPELTVSFAEDPALIAGMRIKVGSDVYDGSLRARLAALEALL